MYFVMDRWTPSWDREQNPPSHGLASLLTTSTRTIRAHQQSGSSLVHYISLTPTLSDLIHLRARGLLS